ncbi:MAG: D-aminoacyl-tRNA deacylase [Bacilli bacterium]|nr:D-aminoacyl-tRNA deacylase [Bacilli bacterium]
MKTLLQLVKHASVTIDGEKVASIENGYLLFTGFTDGDNEETCKKMTEKIAKLRIFPDENGKTNKSIFDVGGNVLSVSQFTLYANCKEGNRPSFTNAMRPDQSKPLFALFNNMLREKFPNLETGVFGADMKVELLNDGPFTLVLDSNELFGGKK